MFLWEAISYKSNMEKTTEERINEISESITQICLSVAKLWEIHSEGQRPHKTTFNIMVATLIISAITSILSILIAVETFLLLKDVHAIYSLML